GGPAFIEAITYRYHGHNTGEVASYRTAEEVERWQQTRDPIEGLRRALETADLLETGRFDEYVASAREAVADAISFAESSPLPDPATAAGGVTRLSFDVRGPA